MSHEVHNSAHAEPIESTGIGGLRVPAIILAVLGIVGCVAGLMKDPVEFYRAYLPAWIFWCQITAGCLGLLCLQYVTGGNWGVLLRRSFGAGARNVIVIAICFIPVVLGMKSIYVWANHDVVAHDALLQTKSAYLNPNGFTIRAVIFFVLWAIWAFGLKAISRKFESTRSPYVELSRRRLAAPGIVMIMLTLTFASADWSMSVEPKWFSSMYGISFAVASGLAAMAFCVLVVTRLAKSQAMANVLRPGLLRDLGNLLLAFTMFWAYTKFSEFLLMWYANLKEEIPYFLKRMHGTWGVIAISIVIFHFFLPFFMLLMRAIKDRPATLSVVAAILLAMRFIDTYWLVAPAHYGAHPYLSWMSLAALAAIGGIWLFAFTLQIKGQTIIPVHESWVAAHEGDLKSHA